MESVLPITPANFEAHKKRIIDMIVDMDINDIDNEYKMSLEAGIKMGNHANECDICNVFHHLMAVIIDAHRLKMGK